MITIHYQKRKNTKLFKTFEDPDALFLSNTQNYIPVYSRFFNLNENNFNSINLNNKHYLTDIVSKVEDEKNVFVCKVENSATNKVKETTVFFKMAPLLDPYKYMIGKYDVNDAKLFNLPHIASTKNDCNDKLMDANNAAYVDGLFLFFISQLREHYSFIHGVSYYGSFLTIKNEFKVNIFDDIDYLNNSDFFNKHKNILFKVDDYEYLFKNEKTKLQPLKIGNNVSLGSLKSVDDNMFEDIFAEEHEQSQSQPHNSMNELQEVSSGIVDLTDIGIQTDKNVSLKTSSTCSSRSSHTNEDDSVSEGDQSEWESITDEGGGNDEGENDEDAGEDDEDGEGEDDDDAGEDDDEDDEEIVEATIPKFPIQLIAMEHCEDTFDNLILNNELNTDEWYSALMQIIMTLITYQKAFNFTHNDLHTNNVMYNSTNKEYIYYVYRKKTYRVPTYGRIYKIIDFGRSIFKFNGNIFCSDSFKSGGDAATQYNIEPYFDEKKPRLEPNPSFDLCRLACSIFDYLIDDFDEIRDLSKIEDPVKRLIVEWCLDDKGINMLYKNNGLERYPEFKLYKMIARCVHNHIPQAQLERPEFEKFAIHTEREKVHDNYYIDIDSIPCYA